jgi:hypothetical protein
MRSIIKIAIGTAAGILLAGCIAALVIFGLFAAAISDGADDRKPTARAASLGHRDDTDGDGRTDASDADPYSADSASFEPTPEPTSHRQRRLRRSVSAAFATCDANISVRAATTTCPFAQNIFYGYWQPGGGDFTAYSPVSQRTYDVSCKDGNTIVCTAGDGAEVRFGVRAVDLYDQEQADAYAASHDLGPGASADDAYDEGSYDDYDAYEDEGYNDGDGITEPGENIPYYDEGDGYRVRCEDGTYSHSGGIQGACSHHGGVR